MAAKSISVAEAPTDSAVTAIETHSHSRNLARRANVHGLIAQSLDVGTQVLTCEREVIHSGATFFQILHRSLGRDTHVELEVEVVIQT